MTDLNPAGQAYARSLINAGKVEASASWSFSAADGDALLGSNGQDWTTYSKVFLGLDRSATDRTKDRWKYPVAKGGKVYRSAVVAAKQRAAQQGDGAVEKAASELLARLDAAAPKAAAPADAPEVKFYTSVFEFKFIDDGSEPEGTFEGYGSVFNNEDDGGDMMLPGAFDKTLAQHAAAGTRPKMLLNHGGMGSMFGSPAPEDLLPIGTWKALSTDENGLHGKGQLLPEFLETDVGKRTYGAMKAGELKDQSIMYTPREFTRGTKPNEPRRSLKVVDLHEMGPVTFPMNRLAGIDAVKSAARQATTIREFEDFLRDVGGYSHAAAKAIAAGGFKSFASDPRDEDAATKDDVRALAARIRAAIGA